MQKKIFLFAFFLLMMTNTAFSQPNRDPKLIQLLGKWEVTSYSEQGVQVYKKQAPLAQAQKVYDHIQSDRARIFYGYDEELDELSRRATRRYREWVKEDSTREVKRLVKAIETPYFVAFFPDSTVSLYNKAADDESISFPQVKHFDFSSALMSLKLMPPPINVPFRQWDVQILLLTDTRMTLFLPEQASVVELVKVPYIYP